MDLDEAEQYLTARLRERAAVVPSGAARSDGLCYPSDVHLVLAFGRWFTPAPWPSGSLLGRGQPGECYRIADRLAATTDLIYTEGFALDDLALVHEHAWCVTPEGRVADPTWPDTAARAYLGLPLAQTFVKNYRARTQTQSGWPILDQETQVKRDHCRLLRDGLPPEALRDVGRPQQK